MSPRASMRTIALALALALHVATGVAASSADPPPPPDQVGQWSKAINWPIVAVHATLLRTGKVVLWEDHTDNPDPARVWNPANGTFTAIPTSGVNLFCAGHCSMADGRILVDGGHIATNNGVVKTTAFDPIAQTWAGLADMTWPRWYPTATALPDGRVLATSGQMTCTQCIAEIPEVYNPTLNTWLQLNDAPLAINLYPFMYVLPNGHVLAAGSSEYPTATYDLDVNTQTWSTLDPAILDGGSSVMYAPGKILKCGSAVNPDQGAPPASATTYVIDMNAPTPAWRQTASMAYARFYHVATVLPDGNVLVTGGSPIYDVGNLAVAHKTAELWNPTTETWTTMASMTKPRIYHSIGLLLPDGRVVVAGGGRFNGPLNPDPNDQRNAEIYSPPYLFKGARPTVTSAPSTIAYGTPFFLGTPDGATITKVTLIRPGSVTHAYNADQRFLSLTFQQSGGGVTVDAPANPNLAPPGYYMVFIVNSNGVPSVAQFVNLPATVDAQAPSAPGGLSCLPLIAGVKLSWAASPDNVGTALYNIHRSTSPGFTPSGANKIGQTGWTVFSDHGLAAGNYYYRVTAQDGAGNVGSPSAEASAAVTQTTGSLRAAYSFNEGSGPRLNDTSGYGHTGTVSGAAWTTQGKTGNALSFNGSNDFVNLGNPNGLRLTGSSTWSAWVKAFAYPYDDGQIIAKSDDEPGTKGWQFKTSPDTGPRTFGVAISADGNTNTQRYSATTVSLNTWYHVAGVYNATAQTLNIYVNGALDNGVLLGTVPASQFDPPLEVNIGRRSGGYLFNGIIDDLRVYARALTLAEIQADMNASVVDVGGGPPGPRGASLGPVSPNPFRTQATLAYAVPRAERVQLQVFNILGQRVATLVDGLQPPGEHRVTFEPKGLPSGVYLCRMQAGGFTASAKLFLLR